MSKSSQLNRRFLGLPLLLRLLLSTLVISGILILTQSVQIFPGAVFSFSKDNEREASTLPDNVESIFIATGDGESLELWRLPAEDDPRVAIIFHGNAGDVENFFPFQQYFSSRGITSYGFDYRGYGKSSGWPSESGLYLDTRAVIEEVLKREQIGNSQLILVGVSIGSGPASFGALEYNVGTLFLFSPFISLPEVIKQVPLYGFLHPFSFFEFPVKKNVEKLDSSCLIVAHGEKDRVIPFAQGREVFESYTGSAGSVFVAYPRAGHNDILFSAERRLAEALESCK